jgi:hypothetical protein
MCRLFSVAPQLQRRTPSSTINPKSNSLLGKRKDKTPLASGEVLAEG